MADSVYARFNSAHQAQYAARELVRQGLAGEAITVVSDEPMDTDPNYGPSQTPSHISTFAVLGGLIGGGVAVLLTVVTAKQMSLAAGAMPTTTPWAFGIPVFETAALGAILALVARMVFEAGLFRKGSPAVRDAPPPDGGIILAVDCSNDWQARMAAQLCQRRGARIV